MKTWTKESNGRTLTIEMDPQPLIDYWRAWIDSFEKALKVKNNDEDELEGYGATNYYRVRVRGGIEEIVSIEECIAEFKGFIDCINKMLCEDSSDNIFDIMPLKKDGSFKLNTKPVIMQTSFGPYWEDSYGWQVHGIRIEPISNVRAHIVNASWVEHY